MCIRWRGSMPLNGSSSSSTCGSCTSAAATRVRCRMPLENVSIRRSCASVISTRSSARAAAAAGSGSFCILAQASTNSLGGEEAVHRLAFGDQAQGAVDGGVAPGGHAVDGHRAARRRQEAGHHVQHRGLAGAVRAEQAGHPGLQGHADVVDRDDVAVPAGDVLQFDDAHCMSRCGARKTGSLPTGRPPSGSGPATAAGRRRSGKRLRCRRPGRSCRCPVRRWDRRAATCRCR